MLHGIFHRIDNCKLHGFAAELNNIPAHVGIDGNEAANESAKEVTGLIWKKLKPKRTREKDNQDASINLHLGPTKKLSPLVIQMRIRENWLCDYLFPEESPQDWDGIDVLTDKEIEVSNALC